MQRRFLLALLILIALGGTGIALVRLLPMAGPAQAQRPEAVAERAESAIDAPIQPVPFARNLDPDKVALGERLFHDPRLSGDNRVACASCHDLRKGGTDQAVSSIGINGAVVAMNAPTVFNSGLNFKQFWNGRAESLEDQVDGPVHAAKEMASNWTQVIRKLEQDADYRTAFDRLYTDGIEARNVKDAIAAFERSLLTPDCRFDRFLRGQRNAISQDEKKGYELFTSYGCVSCHQGANVGGNMYQTFGAMADYLGRRGRPSKSDLGRFNLTGNPRDRYTFKVPGLRNVARTAPYFHDGSAATLEKAVEVMGKYQLGRELTGKEVTLLVKFLKTLTGEYKGVPL